jgi:hypothetical protein
MIRPTESVTVAIDGGGNNKLADASSRQVGTGIGKLDILCRAEARLWSEVLVLYMAL